MMPEISPQNILNPVNSGFITTIQWITKRCRPLMRICSAAQNKTLQGRQCACSITLLLALQNQEFQLWRKGFLNSIAPSGGLKENAWLQLPHSNAGLMCNSFSNHMYQQQLEVISWVKEPLQLWFKKYAMQTILHITVIKETNFLGNPPFLLFYHDIAVNFLHYGK